MKVVLVRKGMSSIENIKYQSQTVWSKIHFFGKKEDQT